MKALTKQDLMELGIDVSKLENGEYLVRHYSRNNRSLKRSLKVIKVSFIGKKHPYVVILDDDSMDITPYYPDRLVQTDFRSTGLDEKHADRAIAILNK